MKKIGLAVCYDTKNFGSQLQVLATNYTIEKLGYSSEIIRYKKKITPTFIIQTIPRLFNPYFIRTKIGNPNKKDFLKQHPDINDKINIRNKRFNEFLNKNIKNLSKYYEGWESLKKESNKNYDTFICGSDQLWLPSNLGSHFYTLEFANSNKNKISYATSFGVSQIPWFQKRNTKKYLNKLSFISCRENKGAEIIKNLTGRDAQVVCDPTMLLQRDEWDKLIKKERIIKEKYIFCYFLGINHEHRKLAKQLQKKTGYKIVTIPFLDHYYEEDIDFGDYQMFDVDAGDFVNLIRNAEFVLTDSFHGSIFSILYEKQFITFKRFSDNSKNSRNSRINSLFKIMNLSDRIYKEDIYKSITKTIDYKKVEKNLNNIRNNSTTFLKNALENKK